ncbi:hypothetical protein B0P06_006023 [Clostridium saccharoperbutylacetonicum]|uniref:Uncharacterized protein n=1 Tax=Clostridium saccharoperbutylacetonicum N1-4(HMT) TaxID=931276 RepID=M1M1U6_9CLOT|nr:MULTISPECIES: hypothetical protein [Clostridium]AGF59595.1 hypothetical protein Cspa_135p00350 [Clostridium saccharoperbutylacetonicum N1-4(HMT)]NRT64548.1 hypothetical protein [Clostridium saccharoperbutylacetonicum]NSB29024.1 hypothetical protein [Clostridium saccharoperbutylacetonicum]NSB46130.1 hypothetical protein [Clostridium saccharoperbutylacetonicum]OOM46583.1 hypothetical protein CLBKI_51350 [Clostridium beijerinckii]
MIVRDFAISDNGELKFDISQKDAARAIEDGLIRQIALCRIKSVVNDWFNTNIGANLEEFIGEACNETTAKKIISAIENSVSYDGFLSKKEIYCISQLGKNSIGILVFINSQYGNSTSLINVRIDVVGGVKINYGTYKQ